MEDPLTAFVVTTATLMAIPIIDRGQVPGGAPPDTVYGPNPCGGENFVNLL